MLRLILLSMMLAVLRMLYAESLLVVAGTLFSGNSGRHVIVRDAVSSGLCASESPDGGCESNERGAGSLPSLDDSIGHRATVSGVAVYAATCRNSAAAYPTLLGLIVIEFCVK
jgi:hypothetical protein